MGPYKGTARISLSPSTTAVAGGGQRRADVCIMITLSGGACTKGLPKSSTLQRNCPNLSLSPSTSALAGGGQHRAGVCIIITLSGGACTKGLPESATLQRDYPNLSLSLSLY